jgi:hypothetical protein
MPLCALVRECGSAKIRVELKSSRHTLRFLAAFDREGCWTPFSFHRQLLEADILSFLRVLAAVPTENYEKVDPHRNWLA